MVPTTILSWVTPPETSPGTPSLMRCFMSALRLGALRLKCRPARRAAIQSAPSWTTPATATPHASTMPDWGVLLRPSPAANSMAVISTTLSRIGAAAAMLKRPKALSAPESSATSDMHSRYGKAMRVSSTARSNFSGVPMKPGASAYMSHGMAISASAVTSRRTNRRPASASSAKERAACGPSPSRRLANNGTKAELKAPSPNRRRNRLGKRKATKKASATAPVPSTAAIRMSRAKPSTRLTMVKPPTVAKAR